MATRKGSSKSAGKTPAAAKSKSVAKSNARIAAAAPKTAKAPSVDRMAIDLAQLETLMETLDRHGITELEIEKAGERIVLRRGSTAVIAHAPVAVAAAPAAAAPSAAATKAAQPAPDDANVVTVTSPFVGTFYRAATPTAAPFVEVGASVRAGQTLCIVEAMKLMNEIECEVQGTVVEVLAENGKPVEYGDKLFKIRRG